MSTVKAGIVIVVVISRWYDDMGLLQSHCMRMGTACNRDAMKCVCSSTGMYS